MGGGASTVASPRGVRGRHVLSPEEWRAPGEFAFGALSRPMKIHPSDLLLEEFLSSSDGEAAVSQHLARCCRCRQRLGSISPSSIHSLPGRFGSQGRGGDYDAMFARI